MAIHFALPRSYWQAVDHDWQVRIKHLVAVALFFVLLAGIFSIWKPEFVAVGAPTVLLCGFLAGVLHSWALFSWHDWTNRTTYYWESIFTIICASIAEMAFWIGGLLWGLPFRYFDLLGPWLALIFLLPYLVLRVFDLLQSIPVAEYKIYFPGSQPPMVVFDETGNTGIVFKLIDATGQQLCLPKELGQALKTLPEAISVGGFFHAALVYHRRQGMDDLPQALFVQEQGKKVIGWVFYQTGLLSRRYQNPLVPLHQIRFRPRMVLRSNGESARLAVAIIYAKAVF